MGQNGLILNTNFRIVEYDKKYAEAIAEMWQQSQQGWMGDSFLNTAEDVINDEENSLHLKAWLAIEKNIVIGYCNIYEYQEETGALYIGLLNVRDAYHGKKIGKALVINAVQHTINSGWDRLDLYTWPGNTLAVPLYKKCGFFWENRDDATHLMNFIPLVLKNKLVKDYFAELDWYDDSVRKIEVKPDGRKENKFEYLQYHWKKDDMDLMMEFCRRGRGLRKIETEKYSIEVTVENLKLVFGNSYKVFYKIINKQSKPLKISLLGRSEKNIVFQYAKNVLVEKMVELQSDFLVNPIESEQSSWKTHPCVITEISIDGKTAEFKVGIEPKFPAKIELKTLPGITYKNVETELFIDIENFFDEAVTYTFALPDSKCISWLQKSFKLNLKPNERISYPTKFIASNAEFYTPTIDVKVEKSGENFNFNYHISKSIQTFDGVYSGKDKTLYAMGCGKYYYNLTYKNFLSNSNLGDFNEAKGWLNFRFPRLGMPYKDEFNKKPVDSVQFLEEENSITMKANYSSDKYEGIKFSLNTKLSLNGFISRWLEIENASEKTYEDLLLKDGLGIGISKLTFSYKNEIIQTSDDLQGDVNNWDSDKISENWVFIENGDSKIGINWNDDAKFKFGNWERFIEYKISKITHGESIKFKPIIIALNNFNSYHFFRKFALKKHVIKEMVTKDLKFSVNNGNPFIKDKFCLQVEDKSRKAKGGVVKAEICNKMYNLGELSKDNKKLNCGISDVGLDEIIKVKFDYIIDNVARETERVIFPIGVNKIELLEENISDRKVLKVDNGKISFSSSDEYAPSVFSLKYRDNEWLKSSFPKVKPFSWWSPWIGGIHSFPEKISSKSILEENFVSSFTKQKDIYGNNWEGMKIEISIDKNELYKGLIVEQYFLTLPNLPVLWHTIVLKQNSGRLFLNDQIETGNFFEADEEILNCSFITKNLESKKLEAFAGKTAFEYNCNHPVTIKGKNRKEKLLVYFPNKKSKNWFVADNKAIYAWIGNNVILKTGEEKELTSRFYIFTEEELSSEQMNMLDKIKLS